MLGIGGKFVGAKGMVAVPNLSGLTRSAAQTAITNAGLNFLEGATPVDTTNLSLDNKVAGQSLPTGTLVDYETTISYSYNRYVAPAPSGPTLVGEPIKIEEFVAGVKIVAGNGWECSGTTKIITPTEQKQISYRYNYSDGTFTIVRAPSQDGPIIYIENDKLYQYNSTDCGYEAPVGCDSVYEDEPTVWGDCVGGSRSGTITAVDTTCDQPNKTRTVTESCCVSTQIFVSSWKGSCISCYRLTAVRTKDSCTGDENVERGSEYCCSGGGGGGGGTPSVAL